MQVRNDFSKLHMVCIHGAQLNQSIADRLSIQDHCVLNLYLEGSHE